MAICLQRYGTKSELPGFTAYNTIFPQWLLDVAGINWQKVFIID